MLWFLFCSNLWLWQNEAPSFPEGRWVDLTHNFSKDTLYWPTGRPFKLESEFAGMTEKGFYYEANRYSASEHGGTHLDAPVHFAEGRWSTDEIPLEKLTGPGVVIDVRAKTKDQPDYQVGTEDFLAWEKLHGRLPKGSIVLLNTGWAGSWPDAAKYLGTAKRGAEAVSGLHFPGLDPEAARWLAQKRDIDAIGLDTPSIDFGQSTFFESHQILFAKNIPAFENVANLDQLPPTGTYIVALPMKIEKGSGGPLRIIALLP